MPCLNQEQIKYIRDDLKGRKVSKSFLFEEWVDHVCCDVETLMNKGVTFEDAFRQVSGQTGESDIRSAHRLVQQFLNNGYVGIKKLLLFAFVAYAASWIINLQGTGNWVGLVSFFILGIVYLRISLDFIRKRFLHRINVLLSVLSLLSFLGTLSGILLIFLNRTYGLSTRGHGVDLTVFGWFFFSLACLIYYSREYRSTIEGRDLKRMPWFIALASFNIFLALLSIASFPLYHYVKAYLFYLIGFITGFNLVAILVMLLSRSMKHTLILTLVIGSFMIVFIHSPFRSKLPGGKPKLNQVTLLYTTEEEPADGKLYITMYYDRFPDKPITLPLNRSGDGQYELTMPSYNYHGFLFYSILNDSLDAREYFIGAVRPDSVRLNVPAKKKYQLGQ